MTDTETPTAEELDRFHNRLDRLEVMAEEIEEKVREIVAMLEARREAQR